MRRVRRRSTEALQKAHIQLYEGDFKRLEELFPTVAPGYVIRQMVRATIRRTEAQIEAAQQKSLASNKDLADATGTEHLNFLPTAGSLPEEPR